MANTIDDAYRTLACEIALYAYNDYIRYTVDLYCLDNPDENDFTTAHYLKLAKQMKEEIKFRRLKCKKDILDKSLLQDFYHELPIRKKFLRRKREICEAFFQDPNPIAGYVGIDDSALAKGDEMVDHWLATGEVMLLKTVRAERGTIRNVEVYDV